MPTRQVVRAGGSFAQRACLCGVLGCCSGALAAAPLEWSGSLGLTSDYVQMGLSQTWGEPALQGGARVQVSEGWTVGAWGSQFARNTEPDNTVELDVFAARVWQWSPDWVATLTATHYFYLNDTPYFDYDYDELAFTLGFRSAVFATIAWSPNLSEFTQYQFAVKRQAVSYEITLRQPLVGALSFDAGAGYRDLTDLFDESYWYGHAGFSYSVGRASLHFTYTHADHTAQRLFGAGRAASTWLGAAIWRFGAH
jgi:uncharacterized protein (TIGR02001 family)